MDDAHNKAPMVGKGLVTVCSPKASRAVEEKGLAGAASWSSCCQHCWSQCWAKSPPGTRASKGRHQGWALPTHAHQQPTQGGRAQLKHCSPDPAEHCIIPSTASGSAARSHTKEGVTAPAVLWARKLAAPGSAAHGGRFGTQGWDSGHSPGTAPGAAVLWSCLRLLLCFPCSRQRL